MGPYASEAGRYKMRESPIPEYGILAKNMIIADDWDHFDKISEYDVIGNGTHAQLTPYLEPYELDMGRWYRSKEKFEGGYLNYFGIMSNKKWHLNEVISHTNTYYIKISFIFYIYNLKGNVKTFAVFSTSK